MPRLLNTAMQRISAARTQLVLNHVFFGDLALRFKIVKAPPGHIADRERTMATDGVSLFYHEDFVQELTNEQLVGVIAHETMHPAMQHHTRLGNRNPRKWNVAGDFAINPILIEAKFTLPPGGCVDEQFKGMSAEQIYELLPDDNAGDGRGGASCGIFFEPEHPQQSETDW